MDLSRVVQDAVERVSQGAQIGGGRLPQYAETWLGGELTRALGRSSLAAMLHAKADREAVARRDVGATYFLGRDLEYIVAEPFPVEYDLLQFRSIVPVVELPPGTYPYTFRMQDRVGLAAVKADLSGRDVPRVDVSQSETQTNPFYLVQSYGWTIEDLRRAARAQMPLDVSLKQAAMDVIEEGFQRIALSGDAPSGMGGLFARTFAGAPAVGTLPNTGAADTLTFEETLANFSYIIHQIAVDTRMRWGAGSGRGGLRVGVSPEVWAILAGLQKDGVVESALAAIQALFRGYGAEIAAYPQLATAGAGGDDRIVAWHYDPRALRMAIQEYQEVTPQWDAFSMVVYCYGATTGIVSPYPLSSAFYDQANT